MKLFIIVHENAIKSYVHNNHDSLESDARRVLKTIQEIKKREPSLEIENGSALNLHPEMPTPDNELEILVCGEYKQTCCAMQLYSLRKAGYSVSFREDACFDNHLRWPSPPTDLKETIPELFP